MPRVPLTILNPAQNPLNQVQPLRAPSAPPFSPASVQAQNPISTNPLFRRPTWTYVGVSEAPRRGPQPRLAQGTGRTGDPALPGNAAQLPGFLSDNDYLPSIFEYESTNQQGFTKQIPRTIGTGENGRELVGTYNPHDFTPGQRFFHHMRAADNWQVMGYPPNIRNLLAWQQVQKYRIQALTISARPLDSSQYFLGYQVNPQVASQIGQNSLGYMGSF